MVIWDCLWMIQRGWSGCLTGNRDKLSIQPSMLPGPAVPGCCLVSFCFLCDIHSIHSVFLVILMDKTVSVGWDSLCIKTVTLKMGKKESPQIEWEYETQGFLTMGHSNWTICSLLNWFCSKEFPPIYLLYWERPFLITPERGRSRGWKWKKRNSLKVDETQGFLTLGHSNWTICSLLNWFCSKKFPPFCHLYWEVHFFFYPRERERERERVRNWKQ